MKLTWTFYPRYESSITLTVCYEPQLDGVGDWGFLHVTTNQAWVCWDCFRTFDKGDVKAKKDAFARLVKVDSAEAISNRILLT
jgi:hypothetical protein